MVTVELMGAVEVTIGLVEAKHVSKLMLGEAVMIGVLIVSRVMEGIGVSELLKLTVVVLLLSVSVLLEVAGS